MRKRRLCLASWILMALILHIACKERKNHQESSAIREQSEMPEEPPRSEAIELPAYEVIETTSVGAVRGTVRLAGEVPALEAMPVGKDQEVCGLDIPDLSLRLGPGAAVADAVVSLRGIERGKELPSLVGVAEIELRRCVSFPRLRLVPLGATLEIHNRDPILHEVHGYVSGKGEVLHLALPVQGFRVRAKLEQPGIIVLRCAAGHPWMSGYVVVQEHPYYAVTEENGSFTINQVPAGSYRLGVWHELLGEKEIPLTVEVGATVSVVFELTAPPSGPS
jgi:hypothetical protein